MIIQVYYHPFGMKLPGRNGGAGFTFGFQGQLEDDEIKGDGNSINFEYRMHDPRIGRFFAPDPLEPKYPHYSPYIFSGNEVICAIEWEGLEPVYLNGEYQRDMTEEERRYYSDLYDVEILTSDQVNITSESHGQIVHWKANITRMVEEPILDPDTGQPYEYEGQPVPMTKEVPQTLASKEWQFDTRGNWDIFWQQGPIDLIYGVGTGRALDAHYAKFENGGLFALEFAATLISLGQYGAIMQLGKATLYEGTMGAISAIFSIDDMTKGTDGVTALDQIAESCGVDPAVVDWLKFGSNLERTMMTIEPGTKVLSWDQIFGAASGIYGMIGSAQGTEDTGNGGAATGN